MISQGRFVIVSIVVLLDLKKNVIFRCLLGLGYEGVRWSAVGSRLGKVSVCGRCYKLCNASGLNFTP